MTVTEGRVRVDALAKLTVSLRITGVRDDGYHLVDAEMVTLDLHDTLTFTKGDGLTIASSGASVSSGAGGGGPGVPTDDSNLVRRALDAVGRTAHVTLEKRIPAGAGLGGGSADAAAVLRWAGCTDVAVAASLGADVPFCLLGGRARVRGIGEVLEPLPFVERAYTLLTPPFGCSTVAVYRMFDRLGVAGRDGVAARAGDGSRNDLEAAALAVEPRLAVWRDRLAAATGAAPALAGSGSTWFVEGEFPGEGRIVARTAQPA